LEVTQNKIKILAILWETGRPMRSREVAERAKLSVPSSTMHLIQLRKKNYVFSPKKSLYTITALGKEVIGLLKIDKKKALAILSSVPEKAFYFYSAINQYIGISTDNLVDFCKKIQDMDPKVIEFHTLRGDFEFWFHDLGDEELVKKMKIISKRQLSREELQKIVYTIVKSRCEELISISRKAK